MRLFSINFFGFHFLIKGTIQGRLRTTKFHIYKYLQPSIQDVRLETHYVYKQSLSIFGALGIKM